MHAGHCFLHHLCVWVLAQELHSYTVIQCLFYLPLYTACCRYTIVCVCKKHFVPVYTKSISAAHYSCIIALFCFECFCS